MCHEFSRFDCVESIQFNFTNKRNSRQVKEKKNKCSPFICLLRSIHQDWSNGRWTFSFRPNPSTTQFWCRLRFHGIFAWTRLLPSIVFQCFPLTKNNNIIDTIVDGTSRWIETWNWCSSDSVDAEWRTSPEDGYVCVCETVMKIERKFSSFTLFLS